MKNQLKYLLPMLLLLPILSYTGCKEDDDPVDPLELLPPLTNTGENTFGCLVNGEAFVVKSSIKADAVYQRGILDMGGDIVNKSVSHGIILTLYEPSISAAEYKLNSHKPGKAFYIMRSPKPLCVYETNDMNTGTLNIHYFDADKYIISGTFEFTAIINEQDSEGGCQDTVRVTDGRFDFKYIP